MELSLADREYYFIYDIVLDVSINYFVPIKYRSLFEDISRGKEGVKYTGKENTGYGIALSFTVTGLSEGHAEEKLFAFMDEIRIKHSICFAI